MDSTNQTGTTPPRNAADRVTSELPNVFLYFVLGYALYVLVASGSKPQVIVVPTNEVPAVVEPVDKGCPGGKCPNVRPQPPRRPCPGKGELPAQPAKEQSSHEQHSDVRDA